jgi:ABC-2 type transport system permease protein
MYVAPTNIPMYLFGWRVAKFVVGSISVLITIIFGMLFLQLNIQLSAVNYPLFFLALFIGVLMLAMMGLILAGITLLISHHVWFLGEAVAGVLYLFSGAIFPLEVLPPVIRRVGYIIPITYWLELLRRAMVGSVAEAFPTLSSLSNEQILGILIGLTIIFGVLSIFVFRWAEQQARERGLIDMVTNY